jgi:hypothetical protein
MNLRNKYDEDALHRKTAYGPETDEPPVYFILSSRECKCKQAVP